MLATPRPANATPMSAEKARVVAVEWRTKLKKRKAKAQAVLSAAGEAHKGAREGGQELRLLPRPPPRK